ncbi:MAG: DUF1638 domain-containing protein [Rhodobacteraceae bacterium]|nr:MAG: DUF1638 domain-containing protein [Paracoccaceae bacterium]
MAPPPAGGALARVMLIACGALAREILALRALNGWSHLDLECLPAKLHNRPERIPEAVRAKARAARARGYGKILAVYADCGTGGRLDAVCAEEGIERIPGPHCYAFFDGLDAFAARAEEEIGAFYLTDFLARQFDALVWRGLGIDRHPEIRELLFAHYDRVVHLAQTDDPALDAAARAAAAQLGLRYERRFTGYGDLATALSAAAEP